MVFILLCFATVGLGWRWYTQRASDELESVASTATVTRRDFSSSVLATGAVQPQVGAEVKVGARISGKVERLLANIGDRVTKGQIIAELEKKDLEATVAQRDAELQLALAKLAAVEILLPKEIQKAELDVSRWRATRTLCDEDISRESRLLESNATSQQSFEQARERLAVAVAQLASAEKAHELAKARYEEDGKQASAEVDRASAALENAHVQLSYATITAPIDGVIASVSTEEGETVSAGMQTPTFVTIIDLQRLQVDAYVDEVDIGKVEVGQRSMFTVDAFPAAEFEGKVTAIYPKAVIQDNVVNYDVVVDIETPYDGQLRPEMTANVTIFLANRKDVLAVPSKAVHRERGKNVVHVQAGDRAERREIKVGWRDGQWIEVAAGLQEGDIVLLEDPSHYQEQDQELP
jgi:macrolide-specific efflux system membrane fusion protein